MQMELQWMVMSCDPNRPERETCEELPVQDKKIHFKIGISSNCELLHSLRGNKFNRPALRRVLLVYRDSTAPP